MANNDTYLISGDAESISGLTPPTNVVLTEYPNAPAGHDFGVAGVTLTLRIYSYKKALNGSKVFSATYRQSSPLTFQNDNSGVLISYTPTVGMDGIKALQRVNIGAIVIWNYNYSALWMMPDYSDFVYDPIPENYCASTAYNPVGIKGGSGGVNITVTPTSYSVDAYNEIYVDGIKTMRLTTV